MDSNETAVSGSLSSRDNSASRIFFLNSKLGLSTGITVPSATSLAWSLTPPSRYALAALRRKSISLSGYCSARLRYSEAASRKRCDVIYLTAWESGLSDT